MRWRVVGAWGGGVGPVIGDLDSLVVDLGRQSSLWRRETPKIYNRPDE
jgi:hypothetical protein